MKAVRSKVDLIEENLDDSHIKFLTNFTCENTKGDRHVELFLRNQAVDLTNKNLVRTRLLFDQSRNLIGFYSLFNDTIKMNKDKRKELRVSLPQSVKVIPAIRLHYIGVNDSHKGMGYGSILMASMLVACATVAKRTGCTLITLESTEDVRAFYEKFDFKHIHKDGDYYIMAMNTKSILDLV